VGPQKDSVFEVPAGYERIEVPAAAEMTKNMREEEAGEHFEKAKALGYPVDAPTESRLPEAP
jgi:hypothetical protein